MRNSTYLFWHMRHSLISHERCELQLSYIGTFNFTIDLFMCYRVAIGLAMKYNCYKQFNIYNLKGGPFSQGFEICRRAVIDMGTN